MVEEMWRLEDGRYGWAYLWSPYWGHRVLIPRLIMLADKHWFNLSNAPLVWINILAQCASAVIMMGAQWQLLKHQPLWARIACLAVTAHLLFSSMQLENFVYGMSVQYMIAFLTALCAIALMAMSVDEGKTQWHRAFLAIFCASVSAMCLGIGIVLWPIMLGEAILVRSSHKLWSLILVTGLFLIPAYLYGYSNPGTGMGVRGVLTDPLGALFIVALFLGGPASDVRLSLGTLVGGFGIFVTCYRVATTIRLRRVLPWQSIALSSFMVFLLSAGLSIAMSRMSPSWVTQHITGSIAERYFAFSFFFWSSAIVYALSDATTRVAHIIRLGSSIVVATLTIGFIPAQIQKTNTYRKYYRGLDAAASGFFVGAVDQAYMAGIYPDDRLLNHWIPYLKERHLAVFSEVRAGWVGNKSDQLFPSRSSWCSGRIEQTVPTPNMTFRLTGYIKGPSVSYSIASDLVFTDKTDTIVGIGRTLAQGGGATGEQFVAYTNTSRLMKNSYEQAFPFC